MTLLDARLFIAEGLDGVQFGGAGGGVEAGHEADDHGEGDGSGGKPPRDGGNFHSGEILGLQIKGCSPSQRFANQPANRYSANSSDEAHRASFREKQTPNVAIGCAECFEYADFTTAFEDRHYERVDDAEGCDREREATEKSQEQIKNGEDQTEISRGVEQRKRFESYVLDRFFHFDYVFWRFHTDSELHVSRF